MTALASACVLSMQLNGIYFLHFVAFSFFKIWSTRKMTRCGLDVDGHNAMCFSEKKWQKDNKESEDGVIWRALGKKKFRMGAQVWRKRGEYGQRSDDERSKK